MDVNPFELILVYMDSKGDRLLYRYPYQQHQTPAKTVRSDCKCLTDKTPGYTSTTATSDTRRRNPYAITTFDDLLAATQPQPTTNKMATHKGLLQTFADEVLSTLFAVKQQLCNQKFELKVNNVRFVCHPTVMQRKDRGTTNSAAGPTPTANQQAPAAKPTPPQQPQQMLINVVFALHAQTSYSVVKCYHELSKRIGLALKVEEQRVGYLSEETLEMSRIHDANAAEQMPVERAYDKISERSGLAQAIKTIYHDLCTTGVLSTTINHNLTLSFCLPQKAHQLHKKGSFVNPETIDRCLRSLKPYHGMLLLVDFAELLDCVSPSGVRMLLQLVEVYTPLMSLQSIASDADLNIECVYKLVSHLVYWAKATIIYPLCETNVYVIAPDSPLHTKSHLVEKFSTRFAGMSLFEVIADFSLPTSIGHLTTPLQQPARQGILAQMVLWMLQHHLLLQLHTYVQFMPSDCNDYGNDLDDMGNVVESPELHGAIDIGGDDEQRLGNGREDDIIAGSMLSICSQPLAVPCSKHYSLTNEHSSMEGSTMSDNIVAQPSSSHKSNYSITASISTENCESIASIEDEEQIKELLQCFSESDRSAIRRIPASKNVEDLSLMVKLYQAGYFKSEHHLEEIMYFENLRRSQLLQLLDKFRDVLIIYETEDPAIASMYNNKLYSS